jgi:hypothetical protein
VRCFLCAAVLQLEDGDARDTWAVRGLTGDAGATITCGNCTSPLEIRRADRQDTTYTYPSWSTLKE